MATIVKRKLSGSTDGMPIKVETTTSPGTTIHTAVAGTTAGTFHEIWLYAFNGHTASVNLTIEFGASELSSYSPSASASASPSTSQSESPSASPSSAPEPSSTNIQVTIANKSGLMLVVPGLILQNGMVVKAFAGTADVIMISGFVNSITD